MKKQSSLKSYIAEVRSIWGDGKDPQLPYKVKGLLERLLIATNPQEPWIAQLIREGPPAKELYRDKDYGFILKGHVYEKGHSKIPHDHGPCWVLYGVYHGVIEITTHRRMDEGKILRFATLEKKRLHRLTPGVVMSYLPGEILLTLAVEHSVVFRFLSSDPNKVQRYWFLPDGVGFRPVAMEEMPGCLELK